MKTTKVKCAECGIEFEKRNADYNRTERIGERHFCSRSCSVIRGNKEMSPERKEDCRKQMEKYRQTHPHPRIDEYSPFREYMRRITSKERMGKYGTPDIDLIYLKELWDKQNGICPYTNIPMLLAKNIPDYNKIHSPKKASLDRIDSSKPYIKGNVEFVCSSVNLGKNSYGREEMMKFFSEIKPNHI